MKDEDFKVSSFTDRGNCVAVKRSDQHVWVKHSWKPNPNILRFTNAEWDAFVKGVKNDEFDI